MRRGQIYWCGLEPRRGHEQGEVRPVLIVSADPYNTSQSPLIGIIPLTRAAGKNPVHIALRAADTGLDSDLTALVDRARFVDRTRLRGNAVGRLGPAAMARVDRNLARVLGLA